MQEMKFLGNKKLMKKHIVVFIIFFVLCCGCSHEKSSSVNISYCNVYVVSPLAAYPVMLNLDKLRKIGYSYKFENKNLFSFSFKETYDGDSLFRTAAGNHFLADCFDKDDFYLGSLTLKKRNDSCVFLKNGKEIQENLFFLVDNIPDKIILGQIKRSCNQ